MLPTNGKLLHCKENKMSRTGKIILAVLLGVLAVGILVYTTDWSNPIDAETLVQPE